MLSRYRDAKAQIEADKSYYNSVHSDQMTKLGREKTLSDARYKDAVTELQKQEQAANQFFTNEKTRLTTLNTETNKMIEASKNYGLAKYKEAQYVQESAVAHRNLGTQLGYVAQQYAAMVSACGG